MDHNEKSDGASEFSKSEEFLKFEPMDGIFSNQSDDGQDAFFVIANEELSSQSDGPAFFVKDVDAPSRMSVGVEVCNLFNVVEFNNRPLVKLTENP